MSLLLLLLAACADSSPALDTAPPQEQQDTGTPEVELVFESAASCGECHPQHYAEWRRSMHAYAARSPVFEAMAAKAYRDSAGELDTFCTRCHSVVGDAEGDGGSVQFEQRSAVAQEGVTCQVCHSATHVDGALGNANLAHDPDGPIMGPYADASDLSHPVQASDFTTSPELCGSCHDVYMYPGLQFEQAYTEYTESPAAADGLRCQDCHMGPEPGLVSDKPVEPIAETDGMTWPARERSVHRFVGPDYALVDDFPYADDLEASAEAQAEQLEQIQALLEASVRISSMAIVPDGSQQAVEVILESLTDGHRVPSGFTSERQLWIELEVWDAGGNPVMLSGDLDSWGDLRDAHSWDVHAGLAELDESLVNLQSVNRTLARQYDDDGMFSSDAVQGEATFPFEAQEIERHSLEPREQRAVRYSLPAGGPYTARAQLHYRNLPPYVLRALGQEALVDRLQIFTIDELEVTGG